MLRTEFKILIERCGCSRASLEGYCTPKKCYPNIYKLAYPKGGMNTISSCVKGYEKQREEWNKEKIRRDNLKKEGLIQ